MSEITLRPRITSVSRICYAVSDVSDLCSASSDYTKTPSEVSDTYWNYICDFKFCIPLGNTQQKVLYQRRPEFFSFL